MTDGVRVLSPAEAGVSIALMGRVRIVRGQPPLERPLKYRKGIALLAYLAVPAGRWHGRDELAELLWPALALGAARSNLRQVLKDLRHTLAATPADSPLRTEGDLVCLDVRGDVSLDVAALSGGTLPDRLPDTADDVFLAGLAWPELPAFESWLHGVRQQLAERIAAVLLAASRQRREAGDLAGAIALARRLLAQAPLDEGHAAWLMALLCEQGDRRAALACYDALALRLRQEVGVAPGTALMRLRERAEVQAAAVEAPLPARFAEVRWLTVLFCLPGASGDGDGQDWPVEVLRNVVAQWNGRLQPMAGRGVMAVFGLGADSERSVARALHAAGDIHAQLHAARFVPRSGVCTGRVLVRTSETAPALLGDVPDLAMQIGWLAAPGDILVPEAVVLQAGAHFDFEPLGARECAAADGPVALYRLRRQAGRRGQPLALEASAAAPFVGRVAMLGELFELWRDSCAGAARIAVLQAGAGLGKTRLSAELALRVAQAGGQVRRLACRLEWRHQPLAPVSGALAELAGIDEGDVAEVRRRKLYRHLATACPGLSDSSHETLLALLDPLAQRGAQGKDAAFQAVLDALAALLHSDPALLIVDDLHWCDQTTLELLGLFIRGLATQPLLLLITSRPGGEMAYPPALTRQIELAPMSRQEALALVAVHDPDGAVAPADRQRIDELLQAELARLGAARQVLCAAAVIGGRFTASQLSTLLPAAEVDAALAAARRQRLVVAESGEGFGFSHALIRDAAYACLPRAEREALHLAAAGMLADQGGARQAVAHHYAAARRWHDAARWWAQAGEQAMAAEFAADAVYCFAEALKLLQAHGSDDRAAEGGLEGGHEGDGAAHTVLSARMWLGRAAQLSQGFGSALAYRQFTDALHALEAAPADTPAHRHSLFVALSGRYMGGSSQGAVEGLDIAWRLADLAQAPHEKLMTSFALGNSLFWRGQLRAARDWQERGIALARRLPASERGRFSVDDPAVTCRAFLCWTLWFLGDGQAGCRAAAEAVALARAGGRMHALCFALTFAAALHWCRGDEVAVRRLSGEASALSRQHGFPLWESVNTLFLLWVAARQQRLPDTAPLFEAAASMQSAYGAGITTSRWIAIHALLARGGAWTVAESLLDTTIAEADEHEDQYCLADLLWQKAACLRHQGAVAEAQRYRRRARALARKQQALGLLARFDADSARGRGPGAHGGERD